MQLENRTGMLAGYTLGTEPSGKESIVVVVKGTFNMAARASVIPELMEDQIALVEADVFSGEPGFSSPLYEVDYAPLKQRCDITLTGSAYAPSGKATQNVQAGFKVGNLSKLINVYGKRHWVASATGFCPGRAQPFEYQAISYDIAFGGVDRFHADTSKHDPYMLNPVGIGYHRELHDSLVDGTPVACTEAIEHPITRPDGHFQPMSFGPIGRSWLPRSRYAGTYDDAWLSEQFPFLPSDFDTRYYQSAPPDQQTDFLQGGEVVSLLNLTEDGKRRFTLPRIEVPVMFFRKNGNSVKVLANLDTLVLEPDQERFTLSWRASIALENDIFDIPEALVGEASRGWWRSRESGVTHYANLDALIKQQNKRLKEEGL